MPFKIGKLIVKSVIRIDGELKNFDDIEEEERKVIATQINKQGMEALGYKVVKKE